MKNTFHKSLIITTMLAFSSYISAQTIVSVLVNQPKKLEIVASGLVTQKKDTIILGENVSITGGTSPYQFAWLKGSQTVGTTLVVKLPGANPTVNYTLKVTDASNCSCSQSSSPTGIDEKEINSSGIAVYPNPSSGAFYIKAKKPELLFISIFDYKGISVLNTQCNGTSAIDLHLPSGLYILRIVSKDKKVIESRKLIIR